MMPITSLFHSYRVLRAERLDIVDRFEANLAGVVHGVDDDQPEADADIPIKPSPAVSTDKSQMTGRQDG